MDKKEYKKIILICGILFCGIFFLSYQFPIIKEEPSYERLRLEIEYRPLFPLMVMKEEGISINLERTLSIGSNIYLLQLKEIYSIKNDSEETKTIDAVYPYVSNFRELDRLNFKWYVKEKLVKTPYSFGRATTTWDEEGINPMDQGQWSVYQNMLKWEGESEKVFIPEGWIQEMSGDWEIPDGCNDDVWKATVLDRGAILHSKRYEKLENVVSYVYDCMQYNRIFYQSVQFTLEPGETAQVEIQRSVIASTEMNNQKIGVMSGLEFVPARTDSILPDTVTFIVDAQRDLTLFVNDVPMENEIYSQGISIPADEPCYLQVERRMD